MMRRLQSGMALLCLSALTACVDGSVDPTERYAPGPFDPCDVEVGQAAALGQYQFDTTDFHRPGPWSAWNTHPAPGCNTNPVIPMVDDEADVELYVTYPVSAPPTQTGQGAPVAHRWPVIVFAHSNHDGECELFERYYSLHDHWASWGFVVASVDATSTNCRPGSRENIVHRIDGLKAAVETLRSLNDDPTQRFYGKLDMERVFYAGHSRGGAAALLAANEDDAARGAIAFQAVDITRFGFGSYPMGRLRALAFTAGNDVDLEYPSVEPNEDQMGRVYSWVDIHGGAHAYTADTIPMEHDDEPAIGRGQQHDIQEYFSTAFLMMHSGRFYQEVFPVLYGFDGAWKVATEIASSGVAIRWRHGADAIWVDRFDGDTPARNELGGDVTVSGTHWAIEAPTYRPGNLVDGTEWDKAWSLWLASAGAVTYRSLLPELEVPATWLLTMRVKGADAGWTSGLRVTLEDTQGGRSTVDALRYIGPVDLENRFTQVVIPLSAFSVDASRLAALEFEASTGQIFIDDVRFSRF